MAVAPHDDKVAKKITNEQERMSFAELTMAIVQTSPDVILVINKTGEIIFTNNQSEELLGYKSEELIGKNIKLLVPNLFAYHQELGNNSRQDTPYGKTAHKYPILKAFQKSRTEILVSVWLKTFPAVSGYETLYQVSIRDAKTRQEIEQRSLTQNIAMSAAANGIVITDTKGIIQWINPAVTKMTGYTESELLGAHAFIFKSGEYDESFYQKIWASILEGKTWRGEVIAKRKDGTLYHEEQSIAPVDNEQGEVVRLISIKQDITIRRQAERELKIANQEIRGQLIEITRLAELLQKTNQELDGKVQERTEELAISNLAIAEVNRQLLELDELKSSFLSVITHELGSPLASTLFTMQLIERGYIEAMSPAQLELFEQLKTSIQASKEMIDNLVNYAAFIRKQSILELKPIKIHTIASQILSILHPKMERKNITLTGSVPPDLPGIQGDEERLADVLHALLENAIKFTPEGGNIHVRMWSDGNHIHVAVADTGIGIEEEEIPLLWESFSQTEDPILRGNLGLGLGLALVKHVVEAHHGEVWAESELGVGSTFGFQLPIEK